MTDDLLDEATRLADAFETGRWREDETRVLRALVERVRDAENEADTQAGIAAIRTAERDHLRDIATREVAAHELQVARIATERDEARAKLDKVRALAVQWSEEAGDCVPPLPPDEPYNLMVNHSRGVLAILDEEPGD